eukprot:GFUD01035239.1.p1 GENE.GFUD01035239.1~~GFUD01035239.1.p1  ORF type:complete len:238 (-),score=69.36 GFUD01035239.1:14-727(-)
MTAVTVDVRDVKVDNDEDNIITEDESKEILKDQTTVTRKKTSLIDFKMANLFDKSAETSEPKKYSGPPKKRQSSDIAGLLSKLDKKFNSPQFTDEVHLKPGDPGYGQPKEGTKTAARGRKAHEDISEEIVKLCQVIWDHGQLTGNYDEEDQITCIFFKDLFTLYTKISSNVVGVLQRARKYEIVHFEGETLFQGQDDLCPIFLLKSLDDVREVFKPNDEVDDKDFDWGVIGKESVSN